MTNSELHAVQSQMWDVIIIGSGMGGATLAYSLCKQNVKVLMLEKGIDVLTQTPPDLVSTDSNTRLRQGWWPQPISQLTSNSKCSEVYAAIGCGVGGSSLHYAAALERMATSDFDSVNINNAKISGWPISFSEFEPYYAQAEHLYGLTQDTHVAWENRISVWDKAFINHLKSAGLKPEKLKVGINFMDECTECIGKVCLKNCKYDAKKACISPLVENKNFKLLTNCTVLSLQADAKKVNAVKAFYNDTEVNFTAKIVVLAAGAIHTPQLLLKSTNESWPHGLANHSDQVGRNLMFHGLDVYAIWSPKRYSRETTQKKSLSIRDFYFYNGENLGFIQSMGLSADKGIISMFIKDSLRKFGFKNELILKAITKIPAFIASKLFGEASIFAAQIEDYPNASNRIILDADKPNGSYFVYSFPDEILSRADKLYHLFKKHLNNWTIFKITPKLEINNGHACGTCKFGNDPKTSVLNADCRAHDVENLYIVDASFFPRSGAANPSLTIAANAIRVSEKILESLNRTKTDSDNK